MTLVRYNVFVAFLVTLGIYGMPTYAQQPDFVEKFALAPDRSIPLKDLIPGSEDYFFYHVLHLQNEGKLAEAEAFLANWANGLPASNSLNQMQFRQKLLNYQRDPNGSVASIVQHLGITFPHTAPQSDRAKDLPSKLDEKLLDPKRLLDQSAQNHPGLEDLTLLGLRRFQSNSLPIDTTRQVLNRIPHASFPGLTQLILQELKAKDSRGWNAFPIHAQLTLSQREELAKSMPSLLASDVFVRQYLTRLLPDDSVSPTDVEAQREHLKRLESFSDSLPQSQNSLKANILYRRLLLEASQENYDLARFEKYLALPRQQPYYNQEALSRSDRALLVQFTANFQAESRLPPIQNDEPLVREYLEHFFQASQTPDRFAKLLDIDYLQRVMAETKILYGSGDSATYYGNLPAAVQKEIRERIELRFANSATQYFQPQDLVQLKVDIKHIEKLIVRVYHVNPRNVYRKQKRTVSTDLDLDGLVANAEQTIEYQLPADRRHRELISLPSCEGRGIWIVDLLGGGLRSRAMIIKGQLRSTQTLTDAGHEIRIYDESGSPVPSASIELGTRSFAPQEDGSILIPYSEQESTLPMLLVDDQLASIELLQHRRESYALDAGILLDYQNLLAGSKGSVILRPRLSCNGQTMPLSLLEETSLTITTIDHDGISNVQTVNPFPIVADEEATHQFLVPPRLRNVTVQLSARVLIESRNIKETVSTSKSFALNSEANTLQIADLYLIHDADGYRLQLRGRNGEPLPQTPLDLALTSCLISQPITTLLATNEQGEVSLGQLPSITNIAANAPSIASRQFQLTGNAALWPSTIQIAAGQTIHLPWLHHPSVEPDAHFSLMELRQGQTTHDRSQWVKSVEGQLHIQGLTPGHYRLTDHATDNSIEIHAIPGVVQNKFLLSPTQTAEVTPFSSTSISKAEWKNGKVRVQLQDAGPNTRVAVLLDPFVPDRLSSWALKVDSGLPYRSSFRQLTNAYVSSLRLDEEYQYILQRQYATKYAGNMLAQPSLLLNPWDTATTENAVQTANAGDPIPKSDASPAPRIMGGEGDLDGVARKLKISHSLYEFLAKGAILLANRRPNDSGLLEIPLENPQGYHSLTIIVIDQEGMVTKHIGLPPSPIAVADQRLAKAIESGRHWTQRQRVEILSAGQQIDMGDANTTRVQLYSTIADVYRFFTAAMPNQGLESFRRLTTWSKLSEEEKLIAYAELACHEVHLFLYFKDRPFFDKAIRPFLADKYQGQLIDTWLLDRPLDPYQDLWQLRKLNALERVLLTHRTPSAREGQRKWLTDFLAANPTPMGDLAARFEQASYRGMMGGSEGYFLGLVAENAPTPRFELSEHEWSLGKPLTLGAPASGSDGKDATKDEPSSGVPAKPAEAGAAGGGRSGTGAMGGMGGGGFEGLQRSRRGRADKKKALYQPLDQTRQWAETQYYRVPLASQSPELVPPGRIWQEFVETDKHENFLSKEFHFATHSLTEALAALAVLDLPFEAEAPKFDVINGRMLVRPSVRSIAFIESLDEAATTAVSTNILVGHDIYLVQPGAGVDPNQPVTGQSLVRGIGYRSSVVVTNPNSTAQTISVLTQIPQGAIPLEAGRVVRSHSLRLEPYSTQQIQYSYYFPQAGQFAHYGAQVTMDQSHVAEGKSLTLTVLDKPEVIDRDTWSYVAQWDTDANVLSFLKHKNAQELDLSLIAFRLHGKPFFEACLESLASQGIFEPTLWSYAFKHQDAKRIAEYLAHREDAESLFGFHLDAPLMRYDRANRYSYQHLDYRPLVNARTHTLGSQRVILNERLKAQYGECLQRLAFRKKLSDDDRMAITYYLLIQGRIEEALSFFQPIDAEKLDAKIQYDYMDAYLDFYRGEYDRAAKKAESYTTYPIPRWRELFALVRLQVAQRQAMLEGRTPPVADPAANITDPIQRMLLDARQSQQLSEASRSPAIDLKLQEGRLILEHQNIAQAEVRYYLMDIELLFSRSPFVQQSGSALLAIQANRRQTLPLKETKGKMEIEVPQDLENRNLVVEVSAEGLIQSLVLYANKMDVAVIGAFGQLQVTSDSHQPVEKAYVKVYARHQGGEVKFYKDGYTDLRGQFDYVSLSTDELRSVERFSILVMHPERGALIREIEPPQR